MLLLIDKRTFIQKKRCCLKKDLIDDEGLDEVLIFQKLSEESARQLNTEKKRWHIEKIQTLKMLAELKADQSMIKSFVKIVEIDFYIKYKTWRKQNLTPTVSDFTQISPFALISESFQFKLVTAEPQFINAILSVNRKQRNVF